MSKAAVNAFMRLVNMDADALAAYVADPPGFVASYVDGAGERSRPWDPAPIALTPDERQALETRDYGALYALGAHPYLLWSFTEAVWVPEVSRADLAEDFRTKAAAAGFPDYET